MAEKNLTAKDSIIRDYDSYQKDVVFLKNENERLISKIDELTKQLTLAKKNTPQSPGSGVTNFDILKRLSNLEKHVFGSKINSDTNGAE